MSLTGYPRNSNLDHVLALAARDDFSVWPMNDSRLVRWKNGASRVVGLLCAAASVLAISGCVNGNDQQVASVASANVSPSNCASLVHFAAPNTEILSASLVEGGSFTPPGSTAPLTGLPTFCRVIARSTPTPDSNIGIEVWMPVADAWNGKYLSTGEGGLAGAVIHSGMAQYLRYGYASASTDTGHSATEPTQNWTVGHPEKIVDFGYRAKHEQTVLAKELIAAFYGAPPSKSYFSGCSNSGRQGLMELQRYPNDYDGYIIGAPANNWTHNMAYLIWIHQASGGNPEGHIPAKKLPAIQAAALKQCDALDGVKDGIISDPPICKFNTAVLACAAGQDGESCLTPPQLNALNKIYAGPTNSRGEQLLSPLQPGLETGIPGITWEKYVTDTVSAGTIFGPPLMQKLYDRADVDIMKFDFDKDMEQADAKLGPILNATDPDLSVQKARGIKIIQYHGWADPLLPPGESIKYYEAVAAKMGGMDKIQDFYKLYMVPAMSHCTQGGPAPAHIQQGTTPYRPGTTAENDVIKALDRWVEEGVAPKTIIATKYVNDDPEQGVVSRRPLCPYPTVQKYKGSGDPNSPDSFECK